MVNCCCDVDDDVDSVSCGADCNNVFGSCTLPGLLMSGFTLPWFSILGADGYGEKIYKTTRTRDIRKCRQAYELHDKDVRVG